MNKTTDILGIKVSAINYPITLKKINNWIENDAKKTIFVSAVHLIMECQYNTDLKTGVNSADLVTPDGMPLVWLSRLSGKKNVSRVYGPTLSLKILALSQDKGYRIFLLGGAIDQSKKLKKILESKFKKINIVGAIDTPIRPIPDKKNKLVIQQINSSKANILFVGLGCPLQEQWIIKNRPYLNTQVIVGVGAAFDFITGNVKQAPKLMRSIGLEWLFRLTQDPKRLWKRYTVTNLRFLYLLLYSHLRNLFFKKKA